MIRRDRPWERLKGFALLAWYGLVDKRAGFHKVWARNAACRECVIYHKGLRTCGSPLSDDPSMGCWCYLPVKNRIAWASCWLRDRTDGKRGWGADL
jgi:hypothetical protein